MYKINNEFKHFIKLVSNLYAFRDAEDILKYGGVTLSSVDVDREWNIEIGIIALVKLYKRIPINDNEKYMLTKYLLNGEDISFDIYNINHKNELLKLIYTFVYRVNSKVFEEVCSTRNKCFYRRDKFESSQYSEYLDVLGESTSIFLKHMHPISVDDYDDDKFIKESNVDFDSDDLILIDNTSKRRMGLFRRR